MLKLEIVRFVVMLWTNYLHKLWLSYGFFSHSKTIHVTTDVVTYIFVRIFALLARILYDNIIPKNVSIYTIFEFGCLKIMAGNNL